MKLKRIVMSLAVVGAGCIAPADLVINGSFETPNVGSGFANEGGTFGNWTADGNVDLTGPFWAAQDGVQSVDLNGSSAGGVYQDLSTATGQKYSISFWMAGNPFGFDNKSMEVRWNGVTVGSFTFDQAGHTATDMGWEKHTLTVTGGTSGLDRLSFLSTTGPMNGSQGFTSFYGPALDNVSVNAVPEPASCTALGLLAFGVFRRKRRPG